MAEAIKEEPAKEEGETPSSSGSREKASAIAKERSVLEAEILSAFEEQEDCARLLYAPIKEKLTFRKTRCYRFSYEGSETKLECFVEDTLLDRVSQEVVLGGKPGLEGWLFYLDYGMKKGVLDLEKEAIMRYYRELEEIDFKIRELELSTRIYVFGNQGAIDMKDVFVRDIVNPAIHRWDLHDE